MARIQASEIKQKPIISDHTNPTLPATQFTSIQPVELLRQLIRIPSVNPMTGQVDPDICFEHRMSDWLVQFFDSIGAPYERLAVVPARNGAHSRDNVIARYDAGDSRPTILLDAHQDTVSVEGMTAPFDPQLRDGRLHGRGACDVKGGLAAMLSAFARLFRERPIGAANVVLSCTCDEEATALGVRDLVTSWKPGARKSQLLCAAPTVCIVAEPTDLNLVVAHRGVMRLRVRTSGTACHASDPSQGVNAIYAMAPVLTQLETLAQGLAIESPVDPLCGSPAMCVSRIAGGTAVNIVPARCEIEIDRRLIPGEEPDQVWAEFNRVLQPLGARCEEPWLKAPALGNQLNGKLSAQLLTCVQAAGQTDARLVGVPYCTNASTLAAAAIPSVVFGPGSIAQAHTADEYIDIHQLETAADIYFRFCSIFSGL